MGSDMNGIVIDVEGSSDVGLFGAIGLEKE